MKEKIHKEKGDDYKPELQKLILLGKVLEDSKTVGEYNIVETSSLVCFAAKVNLTVKDILTLYNPSYFPPEKKNCFF